MVGSTTIGRPSPEAALHDLEIGTGLCEVELGTSDANRCPQDEPALAGFPRHSEIGVSSNPKTTTSKDDSG